jgi:hypothetical protein
MMNISKKFVFGVVLIAQVTYGQNINELFTDSYSTYPDNSRKYSLSIITPNKIDTFFKKLEEDFGAPKIEENQYQYKTHDDDWSDNETTICVTVSTSVNLDKSETYNIWIFAFDTSEPDLLKPQSKSKKLAVRYFSNLFELYLKHGEPESFDLIEGRPIKVRGKDRISQPPPEDSVPKR